MRIGEVCTREVVYCGRNASVLEVAQLMRNHHVGDLIVAETLTGLAHIAPRQSVVEKATLPPVND